MQMGTELVPVASQRKLERGWDAEGNRTADRMACGVNVMHVLEERRWL